jgi:hypothetical protein
MNELKQFQKNIKIRIKAQKRKRDLKARVRQFKQELKALKINKERQEHIKRLKELKDKSILKDNEHIHKTIHKTPNT